MTYVSIETSDFQEVPYNVEQYLRLGSNGELSVPSAHPDPKGGMFIEVSLLQNVLIDGNWIFRSAVSGQFTVAPVLIDYNLSNGAQLVVERREPLRFVTYRGEGVTPLSPWDTTTMTWNVPTPPSSTHDYRIRFLIKHTFMGDTQNGVEVEPYPTSGRFKVCLRGLTQV